MWLHGSMRLCFYERQVERAKLENALRESSEGPISLLKVSKMLLTVSSLRTERAGSAKAIGAGAASGRGEAATKIEDAATASKERALKKRMSKSNIRRIRREEKRVSCRQDCEREMGASEKSWASLYMIKLS
jgi:hypothetical protein